MYELKTEILKKGKFLFFFVFFCFLICCERYVNIHNDPKWECFLKIRFHINKKKLKKIIIKEYKEKSIIKRLSSANVWYTISNVSFFFFWFYFENHLYN